MIREREEKTTTRSFRKGKEMFTYIVKPEEKIVIAIMKGTKEEPVRYDAINFIRRHSKTGNIVDLYRKYQIKDRYVGVARCHDQDNFDEEFGKELAKRRALSKHHRDFAKQVRAFIGEMDASREVMSKRLEKKILNNEMDLTDLIQNGKIGKR